MILVTLSRKALGLTFRKSFEPLTFCTGNVLSLITAHYPICILSVSLCLEAPWRTESIPFLS